MLKKLFVIACFVLLGVAAGANDKAQLAATQDAMAELRDNNCVTCHARLSNPLRLTSRYAEWHMSQHKEKAVGCEKCHGGDPKITDAKRAHAGVLPPKDARSRLHPQRLPETCQACHTNIVSSFVESKHYQKLKGAGVGPSCTTCHQHMASQVLYTGAEAAAMCATCHNSPNKLMPPQPEVPQKADEVVEAIRRANTMVAWADRLLEEMVNRKMESADEQREMKVVKGMLAEAKISFHAFNLEAVRRKADAAFVEGTKLKDELRKKLYPGQ